MKKLFAILLLATIAFNLGGYYVFFWALKIQAKNELSLKLDDGDYNEKETFEIKIPLSLPYPLQTSDFQRKSGHFVYNQEHYQFVKQKYSNDTLTVIAIKDHESNQLTSAMDTFTEGSNQNTNGDGNLNIPVKVLLEYINANVTGVSSNNTWSRSIAKTPYFEIHSSLSILIISPPPKFS